MAAAANHRFWVDMCLECVRQDHTDAPGDQTGPFRSARAMGMALAAPHEVNALAAGLPPLMALAPEPGLVGLSTAQLEVACCAACCEVLKLRYPHQAALLDPAWLYWLQSSGYSLSENAVSKAETAGRLVGRAIDRLGADDAQFAAGDMYSPSGLPYTHAAPPNQPRQGFAGADWGFVNYLLTQRVAGFPPPPGRCSATEVEDTQHFRDDFAKVQAKGGLNRGPAPMGRSDDEEFIGIAWGYDGPPKLGTPPRLYMQAVLSVLDRLAQAPAPAPRLTLAQELELIAGVGLAMAEAGIDAWYYKYAPTHMMWRPAVGIPRAEAGNGVADPRFFPLGRPDTNKRGLALTPDFPAYPSGHATFGAAAFQVLRLYLVHKGLARFDADGTDDVPLAFISDEFDGVNTDPRTQQPRPRRPVTNPSLWQAIVDNSVSRVYLGVHWQFDGLTRRNAETRSDEFEPDPAALVPRLLGRTGGVWLGAQIAGQVARRLGVPQTVIEDSRLA
ncbi:vanadium-dependent haloperoxidase [Aquabacterium sp. OR-4]|uniref:vanadium-dependent haloperoxidase n=1 Tax=Aquabacterium sp. OR-4 TaxID=2978127 RepID=UPI0028C6A5A4|nr:vanadium-dependent haloperoxidase [Aquabacterium sp. OR-4]MDT7838029.1 vanadium-dependent haloperoxidase [Aquabacterium sp. OR-4]